MSESTPLTSTVELFSNAAWISRIIENSYAIHESPGRKSDSQVVKSLLLLKSLKREL